MTTDGHPIRLFEVNSTLVVGRYDGPDGGSTIGTGDPAAFAIHIDPNTGVVTVVQYESIKHDDRGDPDEANDNGTDPFDEAPDDGPSEPNQQWITDTALRVTATVTDYDGDSVSQQFNIGNKIIFQDDGPSLNIVDTPNSVDETQSINGTWTLAEGADGVTSVDVKIGATTHTLSIPSGVLGADPVTHVTFTAAEGAFGTLNIFSDGTWTYTANSVSGGDKSFTFSINALDGDGDPASEFPDHHHSRHHRQAAAKRNFHRYGGRGATRPRRQPDLSQQLHG